jgi:lipopolysaccharide transport system permease protein
MLTSLWDYRGFILSSVQREFLARYRNSILGATWAILNPLALIAVYTLIFSQVMRAKLPGIDGVFGYSIYLCAGLLSWGYFAELTTRGQNMFIENANLLKKMRFPRLCLPAIAIATATVNFSIIFSLFCLFLLLSGTFPGWPIVAVLPVLAVAVTLAVGVGLTLGVLNVFFRDVGQAFTILLQFWFWLTPIVYPASILPASVRPWLALNPLASVMAALQGILAAGQWPDWSSLLPTALLGLALCALGLHLYRRHAADMVDEL